MIEVAQILWSAATARLNACQYAVLLAIQALNMRGLAPGTSDLVDALLPYSRSSIYEAVETLLHMGVARKGVPRKGVPRKGVACSGVACSGVQAFRRSAQNGLYTAATLKFLSGESEKYESGPPDKKSGPPESRRAVVKSFSTEAVVTTEKQTTSAAALLTINDNALMARAREAEKNSAAAAVTTRDLLAFAREACALDPSTSVMIEKLAVAHGNAAVAAALEQYHYGFVARQRPARNPAGLLIAWASGRNVLDTLPSTALTLAAWLQARAEKTAAEITRREAEQRAARDMAMARQFCARPRDCQAAIIADNDELMRKLPSEWARFGYIPPNWVFSYSPAERAEIAAKIAALELAAAKK